MAFYIILPKEHENNINVTYRFGTNEKELGLLKLDKKTGEIVEIQPTPINNSSALFFRAATKARSYWKSKTFPEQTCWAS